MAQTFRGRERPPSTLQPEDAAACRDLDLAALGGLWSLEQWRQELTEQGRLCLGCFEEGELIALACGWLVLDELHITAVAVSPAWRRHGVARRLVTALMQKGNAAGAGHATLEVASNILAAIALYNRCGFQTAGCRRGYYSDGSDALIQWCRLH